MHCLPHKINVLFAIFLSAGSLKDTRSEEKNSENIDFILAFEVIVQPPKHISNYTFFQVLAHCDWTMPVCTYDNASLLFFFLIKTHIWNTQSHKKDFGISTK